MSCEFAFKEELISSYTSFLNQQPSRIFIQAMSDANVLSIPRMAWYNFINTSKAGECIGRLYAEALYQQKAKRELSFLTLSATGKYKQLVGQQSHYIEKVPLKFLASYLGIWAESLTRIRETLSKEDKL